MAQKPLYSAPNPVIILPVLNEAENIAQTLCDLRAGNPQMPIWVVDGGSTDGTQDCVHQIITTDPALRLIHNPHQSQSHAVNLAARRAMTSGHNIFIRADAHARYAAGFAAEMAALLDQTGADSITVPLIAKATTGSLWQRANCALQHGWLGHGGAAHRRMGQSGWVNHGHHAAFHTARFLALGGYDPQFSACEDVDYDIRLRAAGGRIWFAADWPVAYLPRATPRATFHQMRRNGAARMTLARKHHTALGIRQTLPLLASFAVMIAPLGLLHPLFALPTMVYFSLVFALALIAGLNHGTKHILRIAILALLSHIGFGMGILGHLRPRPMHTAKPSNASL